jgi:hypothetical protein
MFIRKKGAYTSEERAKKKDKMYMKQLIVPGNEVMYAVTALLIETCVIGFVIV